MAKNDTNYTQQMLARSMSSAADSVLRTFPARPVSTNSSPFLSLIGLARAACSADRCWSPLLPLLVPPAGLLPFGFLRCGGGLTTSAALIASANFFAFSSASAAAAVASLAAEQNATLKTFITRRR